jgi:hypothetical protein
MNKLTVAAALIAALAVSAPAYADTAAPKPAHAAQKATPTVKSTVRPQRKPLLDGMSTQSIAPRKNADDTRVKSPVAATGIAVSPSFFSF